MILSKKIKNMKKQLNSLHSISFGQHILYKVQYYRAILIIENTWHTFLSVFFRRRLAWINGRFQWRKMSRNNWNSCPNAPLYFELGEAKGGKIHVRFQQQQYPSDHDGLEQERGRACEFSKLAHCTWRRACNIGLCWMRLTMMNTKCVESSNLLWGLIVHTHYYSAESVMVQYKRSQAYSRIPIRGITYLRLFFFRVKVVNKGLLTKDKRAAK